MDREVRTKSTIRAIGIAMLYGLTEANYEILTYLDLVVHSTLTSLSLITWLTLVYLGKPSNSFFTCRLFPSHCHLSRPSELDWSECDIFDEILRCLLWWQFCLLVTCHSSNSIRNSDCFNDGDSSLLGNEKLFAFILSETSMTDTISLGILLIVTAVE